VAADQGRRKGHALLLSKSHHTVVAPNRVDPQAPGRRPIRCGDTPAYGPGEVTQEAHRVVPVGRLSTLEHHADSGAVLRG